MGIVPDKLKLARVIPIYKKGNWELNCLPSIYLNDKLEKLMHERMVNYIGKFGILNGNQFDF